MPPTSCPWPSRPWLLELWAWFAVAYRPSPPVPGEQRQGFCARLLRASAESLKGFRKKCQEFWQKPLRVLGKNAKSFLQKSQGFQKKVAGVSTEGVETPATSVSVKLCFARGSCGKLSPKTLSDGNPNAVAGRCLSPLQCFLHFCTQYFVGRNIAEIPANANVGTNGRVSIG